MSQPNVEALIARFGSDDPIERREAREAIEARGRTLAGVVAAALKDDEQRVRWEAAKALTSIATTDAVPALIDSLKDEDPGVRWLAAEALTTVGTDAVKPVLRALLTMSEDPWFREGAHHVLRSLVRPETTEVVRALEGRFQGMTVPVAADSALRKLG